MDDATKTIDEKFLRMKQVEDLCGIRRSSIYARIAAGTFPAPIKLGKKVIVWPQSRIVGWMVAAIHENGMGKLDSMQGQVR